MSDFDVTHTSAPATKAPAFPYRIFGIGMNKTGTSSFSRALRKLGVGPIASQKILHRTGLIPDLFKHGNYEPAIRFAAVYRVFEDRPWNMWDMYRRLDERYPDSRFVLTYRHPDTWWRSVHRWITVTKPHVTERYRLHLKAASIQESDMIAAYNRFNEERREYFRGRADFLELNFEAGDAWDKLCAFLNLPIPDSPFPHANQQNYDASDALRMLPRRVLRNLRPEEKLVGIPLDIHRCVQCASKMHAKKKGKRRNKLVHLPDSVKEPYRWLQRTAFNLSEGRADTQRRLAALREAHPGLSIDDMAVVTCFFNPTGSRRRVENFKQFRRALDACGLPVLTVELAFGNDPFMLDREAGELLQLRSDSPMWQKERLLNIGIGRMLERGYRKIVWLDADVVFEEPRHWPWFVAAELEDVPLCQVFRTVQIERKPGRKPVPGLSAVRFYREVGAWFDQNPRDPSLRRLLGMLNGYSGFGWAATADLLQHVPLYDRAIVGGGDKLIFAAACPRKAKWLNEVIRTMGTNLAPCETCGHVNEAPAYLNDYLAWAEQWDRAVQGRMTCADLTVRSLYHGEHQNRFYRLRREILLRYAYDPAADLIKNEQGCWKWNSYKPGMHLKVHGYFFARRDVD